MKNSINFTQAGLNKNESIVYKYLLDWGEASPPELSEKLNIGRTNVYAILNSLSDLNLIEEIPRRKKICYKPLPPTNLLNLIEKKKDRS